MKTPNAPGAPRSSGGGQYGKGVSKSGAAARGIGKAKPKTKGLTAAQVKSLRQARIDESRDIKGTLAFRGVSKNLPRGSVNYPQKGVQGSKLSKGKMPMTSNMEAKEGVKSGQLRRLQYSPTNSARQKPVPTKPSKPKVQKKTGRK